MAAQFMNALASITALLAGGIIGVAFGLVQDAARRRNERREQEGRFRSGWVVMPGAGARVAYLLVALVLVQVFCPLLFHDGTQWWVSGGVAGGYGLMLFRQLRQRLKENK